MDNQFKKEMLENALKKLLIDIEKKVPLLKTNPTETSLNIFNDFFNESQPKLKGLKKSMLELAKKNYIVLNLSKEPTTSEFFLKFYNHLLKTMGSPFLINDVSKDFQYHICGNYTIFSTFIDKNFKFTLEDSDSEYKIDVLFLYLAVISLYPNPFTSDPILIMSRYLNSYLMCDIILNSINTLCIKNNLFQSNNSIFSLKDVDILNIDKDLTFSQIPPSYELLDLNKVYLSLSDPKYLNSIKVNFNLKKETDKNKENDTFSILDYSLMYFLYKFIENNSEILNKLKAINGILDNPYEFLCTLLSNFSNNTDNDELLSVINYKLLDALNDFKIRCKNNPPYEFINYLEYKIKHYPNSNVYIIFLMVLSDHFDINLIDTIKAVMLQKQYFTFDESDYILFMNESKNFSMEDLLKTYLTTKYKLDLNSSKEVNNIYTQVASQLNNSLNLSADIDKLYLIKCFYEKPLESLRDLISSLNISEKVNEKVDNLLVKENIPDNKALAITILKSHNRDAYFKADFDFSNATSNYLNLLNPNPYNYYLSEFFAKRLYFSTSIEELYALDLFNTLLKDNFHCTFLKNLTSLQLENFNKKVSEYYLMKY